MVSHSLPAASMISALEPWTNAKLATILALARYFSEHGGDARDLRSLLTSLAIVAPMAGLVFILAFAGLTFTALASAQLNFASIMAFGFSFLIIILALIGLVGAIRNPPDEDR